MEKKRIMILGGNIVQAEATRKARQMGYYAISVDAHDGCPGNAIADEACLVDVINREAVLREAARLRVEGIIPFTSDVLAPVAAYVQNRLSLPGNPQSTVDLLTSKDRFRSMMIQHGFPTPSGQSFADKTAAIAYLRQMQRPMIMKPVDGSGSKGVWVVTSDADIEARWQETMDYSARKTVVLEEYIERKGLQQDGDIFVQDGRIVFWGVGDQLQDPIAPHVPAMLCWPSTMPLSIQQKARDVIQGIITAAGFRQGPCNVEYIVGKDDEIYVLDIGPRNGGNAIPFALQEAYGADFIGMTLRSALGETVSCTQPTARRYVCSVVLHATQCGYYRGFHVAPRYAGHLRHTFIYIKEGDMVRRFHNGGDSIGTLVFVFDNRHAMSQFVCNIKENVLLLTCDTQPMGDRN